MGAAGKLIPSWRLQCSNRCLKGAAEADIRQRPLTNACMADLPPGNNSQSAHEASWCSIWLLNASLLGTAGAASWCCIAPDSAPAGSIFADVTQHGHPWTDVGSLGAALMDCCLKWIVVGFVPRREQAPDWQHIRDQDAGIEGAS